MKQQALKNPATRGLIKSDSGSPAMTVTGPTGISIKAGTTFAGISFLHDTPVPAPEAGFIAGTDYVVVVPPSGEPCILKFDGPNHGDQDQIGGFHFAPGGNAAARKGGDATPAINPCSVWDLHFRPACQDPRGMTLVEGISGKFWCDIYLLGRGHLVDGTSKLGARIADHNDRPDNPDGEPFRRLDYPTAVAVMAHHGKQLLSDAEFYACAFGVTERSSNSDDPVDTCLDAPRTSKWGVIQATGNMWVWGHDGDPDTPRASLFGGSWFGGGSAGSRCAHVVSWPVDSSGLVGARGRSDHLQLA